MLNFRCRIYKMQCDNCSLGLPPVTRRETIDIDTSRKWWAGRAGGLQNIPNMMYGRMPSKQA